ncbi:MAG: thioredoxin family protein [Clostridiales bacterium]|nr:thioredoxin family protein [Clostridiales bacterium]
MRLFRFGKKKDVKEENCCFGGNSVDGKTKNCGCNDAGDSLVSIKVLGSGCKACHELYENTREAVKRTGLSVEVEYITDLEKVMGYGVMRMPGLVVNEKVASMGKVLKAAEVEKLLHKLGY